ncbi:hypothetical protein HD806DRAFT_249356 [Xylariaceae sp. AK1471]|nr:hypothetical protein HD806DRAFT_249356 [Xylariaceae sp. AK1471]
MRRLIPLNHGSRGYLVQGPGHDEYQNDLRSQNYAFNKYLLETPWHDDQMNTSAGLEYIHSSHIPWQSPTGSFSSPRVSTLESSLPNSPQTLSSSSLRPPSSIRSGRHSLSQASRPSRDFSPSQTAHLETLLSPQSSPPSRGSTSSQTTGSERLPSSHQASFPPRNSSSRTTTASQQTTQSQSSAPRTRSTSEPPSLSSPPRLPIRGQPFNNPPPGGPSPPVIPPLQVGDQNMPRPHAGYGTRSLLRDRPVIVQLETGARNYVCNRADILQHLPNTRLTPFGRTFHPHIAREHWRQPVLEAFHALFHGLERYRSTGTPVYLFESARDWLYQENARCFEKCFYFFIGVCTGLDSELGLGCSDELLQQIDEFAIDLMYSHELGFFTGNRRLLDFFMAYSKVFQPTTQRHVDTLRELYDSVPGFVRGHLVMHLTAMLDLRPQRSNANAMFRTMRDLGMA